MHQSEGGSARDEGGLGAFSLVHCLVGFTEQFVDGDGMLGINVNRAKTHRKLPRIAYAVAGTEGLLKMRLDAHQAFRRTVQRQDSKLVTVYTGNQVSVAKHPKQDLGRK